MVALRHNSTAEGELFWDDGESKGKPNIQSKCMSHAGYQTYKTHSRPNNNVTKNNCKCKT